MFKRPAKFRALAAISAVAALTLTACGSESDSDAKAADGLTEVTVVLGWLPTAESGGFYAAQQLGYYEELGLDVTIEPGGPQVSSTQLVASGRAEFGITGGGANEIVSARDQGIPLKAVSAIMQKSATGMMVHADTGITSLEETDGMTWVNSAGVLGPDFAEQELGISFKRQQYTGSLANFILDDKMVQQGIAPAEPYVAHSEGDLDVKFFPFADIGFNPYNTVTYTNDEMIENDPEVVKAFVEASNKGWRDYMGDLEVATEINEYLTTEVDKELDLELTWYEWDSQRDFMIAEEGTKQIGAMTEERWSSLIDQMGELGVLDGEVQVDDVADFSMIPDIAPLESPAPPAGSFTQITY